MAAHQINLVRLDGNAQNPVIIKTWTTSNSGVWHDMHVDQPPPGNWYYQLVIYTGAGSVGNSTMITMSMKR